MSIAFRPHSDSSASSVDVLRPACCSICTMFYLSSRTTPTQLRTWHIGSKRLRDLVDGMISCFPCISRTSRMSGHASTGNADAGKRVKSRLAVYKAAAA